jgi:hypothetical protein
MAQDPTFTRIRRFFSSDEHKSSDASSKGLFTGTWSKVINAQITSTPGDAMHI